MKDLFIVNTFKGTMPYYIRMANELYKAFPDVPYHCVYGFICENYIMLKENDVVHKLKIRKRFQEWLREKREENITIHQFQNELLNIPLSKIKCIVDEKTGKEYYTNLNFDPEELNPMQHSITINFEQ